jgi:CheY-like chemotaxis protein
MQPTVNKRTILLVDDDPDFLEQTKLTLESHGYATVTAGSTAEALSCLGDGSFDGAILDVIMETPNAGFSIARALRESSRTARLPIFLLSSINQVNASLGRPYRFSDADRDDHFLPIDKFLEKPIKPQTLLALVREHMGTP